MLFPTFYISVCFFNIRTYVSSGCPVRGSHPLNDIKANLSLLFSLIESKLPVITLALAMATAAVVTQLVRGPRFVSNDIAIAAIAS